MTLLLDPNGQKLISILLPTRARMDKLLACLATFSQQIGEQGKKELEFIINFDSDDADSLSRLHELPTSTLDIKTIISDKIEGYRSLWYFYNQCARLSSGQYLLMWNDDASFKTEQWLAAFKAHIASEKGANSYWFGGTPSNVHRPDGTTATEDWPCFIAHHRLLYQILGFYSHQGGIDSFIYYVLGPLGLLKKINHIEIKHLAWFQIPEHSRDGTSHSNSLEGAMIPTNFNVVQQCQNKIVEFVNRRATSNPTTTP